MKNEIIEAMMMGANEINRLRNENQKLKQRIDKAIEYIKDYEKTIEEGIKKGAEYTYLGSPLNKINKLLEILKEKIKSELKGE